MKTYMTPEEHARLHRRRARQTLGLLIAVLAVGAIITLAFFAARACRVGRSSFYTIAACAASSISTTC